MRRNIAFLSRDASADMRYVQQMLPSLRIVGRFGHQVRYLLLGVYVQGADPMI